MTLDLAQFSLKGPPRAYERSTMRVLIDIERVLKDFDLSLVRAKRRAGTRVEAPLAIAIAPVQPLGAASRN